MSLQEAELLGKLTASDAAAGNVFGNSVAVSGDTAVIGALDDDDAGSLSGSAYVFTRSGTTWMQQAKLTASDAAERDRFGRSVAVSGDTAVIGANLDFFISKTSGSAYVFTRSGTTWSEQAKLTASDGVTGDFFGTSVAVSGDTVVVGAGGTGGSGDTATGAAYIFGQPDFCPSGKIISDVVLPEVFIPVDSNKPDLLVPDFVRHAELTIDSFELLGPVEDLGIICRAQSSENTGQVFLDIGFSDIEIINVLVAENTGRSLVTIFEEDGVDKIFWQTQNFEIQRFNYQELLDPFFIISISKTKCNTGQFTNNDGPIPLSDLGLSRDSGIEKIIRDFEVFVHVDNAKNLQSLVPKCWDELRFTLIRDPGNVSLLVIDQNGLRVGILPDGSLVNEIPSSFYLPSETNPTAIMLGGEGTYQIIVTGISTGDFTLSILATDFSLTTERIFEGQISAGETLNFKAIVKDGQLIEPADHYLGYDVKETKGTPKFDKFDVDLTDQFGDGIFEVKKPERLYNPVDKNGEGISDLFTHLVGYKINAEDDDEEEDDVIANVLVTNQFGDIILDVEEAKFLLVPSTKDLNSPPSELGSTLIDHYKCYEVDVTEDTPKFEKREIRVFDPNFDEDRTLEVKKPKLLCNPVDKNRGGIIDEENHLLCYDVKPVKGEQKHEKRKSVFTNNQFGPEQLDTKKEKELCVPSMKTLLEVPPIIIEPDEEDDDDE